MPLIRDLPVITGGTVTFTNGSAIVNGTGIGSLWRSTRLNAGVVETEDSFGRGAVIYPVDGSANALAVSQRILRLVDDDTIELLRPYTATATLTNTDYRIEPAGSVSQSIASENLRQAAGRGGPSNPLVLLAMQTGARRAVLMPNADGSVDLGTGSNATDYPSLTMRRLINADGSAAFASLSGATFTGSIAVYSGTDSTQQPVRRMGWSNGVQRWADVLEANANLGFYSYDTGGNVTGSYNLTPQGQLSSSLGTYWHSGIFNPATKADNLTSPTALTNGALIPGTENGRFYSLALPTAQSATLPNTSGLPDGFSIIVRVTGSPSGFQTSWIGGNTKTILYRNNTVPNFWLIGNGEIFRFTWLSGLDCWVAECLQHPGNIQMFRGQTGTTWSNGTTAFTGVPFNIVGGSSSLFNVSSSVTTLVPVLGVYLSRHIVLMSANAGGGTSGTGYLMGIDRNTGVAADVPVSTAMDVSVNSAETLQIYNTQVLLPGQQIGAAYAMSDITLRIYLGNNTQNITLLSR
jgi:hypothetical protein